MRSFYIFSFINCKFNLTNIMKKIAAIFLTVLISHFSLSQNGLTDQQKADALLKQMTLDEKIGQMTQVTLGVVCTPQDGVLDAAALQKAIQYYKVGSILNVTGHALTVDQWHVVITQIQDEAKKRGYTFPLYMGSMAFMVKLYPAIHLVPFWLGA